MVGRNAFNLLSHSHDGRCFLPSLGFHTTVRRSFRSLFLLSTVTSTPDRSGLGLGQAEQHDGPNPPLLEKCSFIMITESCSLQHHNFSIDDIHRTLNPEITLFFAFTGSQTCRSRSAKQGIPRS